MAGGVYGYGGWVKIGTDTRLMCRPQGRHSAPRNLDTPYPISGGAALGVVNYAPGLRFPVLSLPAIPMASWFTAANLNSWFVTRGAGPEYDLNEIANGIEFSDSGLVSGAGLGAFKLLSPKGAGFVLHVTAGQPLGFQMRFAAQKRVNTGIVAPTGGLAGTPLDYSRVTLGGAFADAGIIGITVQYDTGLTPNMELWGSRWAKEQNADLPSVTVTIQQYAKSGIEPPGFDSSAIDDDDPDEKAYPGIAASVSVNIGTVADPVPVTFSMPRLVLTNPDDREQQQGRVVRQFTYQGFAVPTDTPSAVLTIA